jgi:uncharacterized membrane protein YqiK
MNRQEINIEERKSKMDAQTGLKLGADHRRPRRGRLILSRDGKDTPDGLRRAPCYDRNSLSAADLKGVSAADIVAALTPAQRKDMAAHLQRERQQKSKAVAEQVAEFHARRDAAALLARIQAERAQAEAEAAERRRKAEAVAAWEAAISANNPTPPQRPRSGMDTIVANLRAQNRARAGKRI